MSSQRLNWVDVAKGLSIFLVVMYHSTLGVGDATGQPGFMHHVLAFATPFRMPEFFLISGLFLSAVIARPWAQFADRRVVHYLYFYALWALIQIVVKVAIGSGDPATAGSYLLWAIIEPYGVLWFIYLLAVFGAVTKLLWQVKAPHYAVLGVAAALQIMPLNTPVEAFNLFAEYYVYFYAGYVGANLVFALMRQVADNLGLAVIGLGIWAMVNATLVFSSGFALSPDHVELGLAGLPGVRLVLALAGGLAVCTMATVIAETKFGSLVRWLGEHSIVVYLAFVIPMAITRTLLIKIGIIEDTGVLSLLVIAASIAAPLVLYALIQVSGFGKFLFQRPDWAHIPGTLNTKSTPTQRALKPRKTVHPAE